MADTTGMNEHGSPTQVVKDMYEAFGKNDEGTLRKLIAADVEWLQCEGFPGGAHRRGIESVLEGVLRGNKATWTGFRVALDEYIATAEQVVVLGSYAGTHHQTGKTMHSVFTHVYEVRGGQIHRFRQFADTWPMVRAMQDNV